MAIRRYSSMFKHQLHWKWTIVVSLWHLLSGPHFNRKQGWVTGSPKIEFFNQELLLKKQLFLWSPKCKISVKWLSFFWGKLGPLLVANMAIAAGLFEEGFHPSFGASRGGAFSAKDLRDQSLTCLLGMAIRRYSSMFKHQLHWKWTIVVSLWHLFSGPHFNRKQGWVTGSPKIEFFNQELLLKKHCFFDHPNVKFQLNGCHFFGGSLAHYLWLTWLLLQGSLKKASTPALVPAEEERFQQKTCMTNR